MIIFLLAEDGLIEINKDVLKMTKDTLHIKIETDNLILTTLKVEDVTQDYVNWLNDSEINRFLDIDSGQTVQSCLSYVKSFEGRREAALIGIFYKENGLHIGNMTLSPIDWRNKYAWIGISLGRKEYRGRGLAKEALVALTKYCFEELGFHGLRAGVGTNNKKSISLFSECGFKSEGFLRESGLRNGRFEDSYVFSILENELQK